MSVNLTSALHLAKQLDGLDSAHDRHFDVHQSEDDGRRVGLLGLY